MYLSTYFSSYISNVLKNRVFDEITADKQIWYIKNYSKYININECKEALCNKLSKPVDNIYEANVIYEIVKLYEAYTWVEVNGNERITSHFEYIGDLPPILYILNHLNEDWEFIPYLASFYINNDMNISIFFNTQLEYIDISNKNIYKIFNLCLNSSSITVLYYLVDQLLTYHNIDKIKDYFFALIFYINDNKSTYKHYVERCKMDKYPLDEHYSAIIYFICKKLPTTKDLTILNKYLSFFTF